MNQRVTAPHHSGHLHPGLQEKYWEDYLWPLTSATLDTASSFFCRCTDRFIQKPSSVLTVDATQLLSADNLLKYNKEWKNMLHFICIIAQSPLLYFCKFFYCYNFIFDSHLINVLVTLDKTSLVCLHLHICLYPIWLWSYYPCLETVHEE